MSIIAILMSCILMAALSCDTGTNRITVKVTKSANAQDYPYGLTWTVTGGTGSSTNFQSSYSRYIYNSYCLAEGVYHINFENSPVEFDYQIKVDSEEMVSGTVYTQSAVLSIDTSKLPFRMQSTNELNWVLQKKHDDNGIWSQVATGQDSFVRKTLDTGTYALTLTEGNNHEAANTYMIYCANKKIYTSDGTIGSGEQIVFKVNAGMATFVSKADTSAIMTRSEVFETPMAMRVLVGVVGGLFGMSMFFLMFTACKNRRSKTPMETVTAMA